MKRLLMAGLTPFLFAGLPGCIIVPDDEVAVETPAVHIHDAYCGHYYCDGYWYHRYHHVHGPGCGHAYIDGRWTVVVP